MIWKTRMPEQVGGVSIKGGCLDRGGISRQRGDVSTEERYLDRELPFLDRERSYIWTKERSHL
jgi:hypothetical protein